MVEFLELIVRVLMKRVNTGQYCRANASQFAFTNNYRARQYATTGKPSHPRGFYQNVDNQRLLLTTLGQKLAIGELSDWYDISQAKFEKAGGRRLLQYHPSLPDLLRSFYPDFDWQTSKFVEASGSPQRKRNNHRLLKALDRAELDLGLTKPEDWYSVAVTDLRDTGFPQVISRLELVQLLAEKYPDHPWEKAYLLRGKLAQQKRLERAISSLFKGAEMLTNVRNDAQLLNPDTNYYLELDIWIPSLHLAFEYQEIHHYTSSDYAYTPLARDQRKDVLKKELAKEKGLTLIQIPCWWDGKEDSLIATIQKTRPDLLRDLTTNAIPIPQTMPDNYLDKRRTVSIEGIGQPTTACFLTNTSTNPTDWWIFEKYDGVRGFWNPSKRAIYSRRGFQLPVPEEIIEKLPDAFLDGELWFGRDNFQEAMKLAQKAEMKDIDWTQFKYMAFDLPVHKGTYEERYRALEEILSHVDSKYVDLAPKQICTGMRHLEQFFQDVVDRGGEGIILRDPKAAYQPGRSAGYLKHKKFRDAEAKIVEKKGPYEWECELPNGVRFTAAPGVSEFLNRWDPQPGDIVTFKHRGFLFGSHKPKMPSLFRVRPELTWQDVVNNWKEHKAQITTLPVRRSKRTNKPRGYWRDRKNRRDFLYKFANQEGFDPLQHENWQTITATQVINKGGGALLNYFHTLEAALQDSFSEFKDIPIPSLNKIKPPGYWNSIENQKQFLEEYAQETGIQQPSDWYSVKRSDLLKRANGLVSKYASLAELLKAVYPDIPWQAEKFGRVPRGFWQDENNVLTKLAEAEAKLAIQQPEEWFGITAEEWKNAIGPMHLRQADMVKLLRRRYPDYRWELIDSLKSPHIHYKRIKRILSYTFPGEIMETEKDQHNGYRVHIPSLDLIVEINDRNKMQHRMDGAATVINIPFWWDAEEDSLYATLKKLRPELMDHIEDVHIENAISDTIPTMFLRRRPAAQ